MDFFFNPVADFVARDPGFDPRRGREERRGHRGALPGEGLDHPRRSSRRWTISSGNGP